MHAFVFMEEFPGDQKATHSRPQATRTGGRKLGFGTNSDTPRHSTLEFCGGGLAPRHTFPDLSHNQKCATCVLRNIGIAFVQ
jgi:hypothetical protein